ncbi:MAG: serine hydrolase, partial [Planctomycetes bacterium]|nr:serine hydrolase [Planctomycetota bacterium]
LDDPRSAMNLLTQGITTINAGEGESAAPLDPQAAPAAGWQTMAEYFQLLDIKGLPINVAQTVGHTQVRRIVLGDVDRQPTAEELERMKDLVREAMEAGAIGVSSALIYPPAVFADTEELAALAEVAGQYGGRYYTHVRNEGDRLLSRYVRDLGAVSLQRAVAQASAVAANDVMAYDRGRIAEGLAADVIVLDYEKLADRATFAEPHRLSEGVKHVLVNGRLVLDDGKYTGARPGRVLRGPGYRRDDAPAAVSTGSEDARMASFDRLMREFLRKHGTPGAALAVTDRGRLVYARGYGYADVAGKRKATPTSLFRIASISKPITAIAVLQLVERKRLSLDDKVFDLVKHEPHLEEGRSPDPRRHSITVRHLLQHRGGWNRKASFDPMFQSVRFAKSLGVDPPAGPDEVIRCMLGQPLEFEPGQRYAYSNYGYCLLGRVIEALTDRTYEEYVKENVLAPLGITSMRIGRTRPAQPAAGEVRYYDPGKGGSVFADDLDRPVPSPYGAWYLEAMDAHGGWIASAVDLARLACAFNDPAQCKILDPASIEEMFARPPGLAGHEADGKPKAAYYSLGWWNRVVPEGDKFNRWHTGSLPGTATILVRRHDGRNWVVLFNARVSPHASHLTEAIDPLMHQAADEVRRWPKHDLFERFPN